MKQITVFTDGGARGNPGPAAIGVYIMSGGKALASIGKRLGEATNNVAEYKAVLEAYDWLLGHIEELKDAKIEFLLDSLLVCSQMQGRYKIKHPNLKTIYQEIKLKEARLELALGTKVFYKHIPRELNRQADRLVNLALDNPL